MAKSSPNATGVFSTRALERIYELLESKSFVGFWEVGRILNERLGERAPYGALAKLNVELPKIGDEAPTSLAQLHQCRRLNDAWSKKDAKDADRAGLPWERAFALIYIWSAATKRHQPEIVSRCKELVAEYAGLGRGKKGPWNAEVKALKNQARAGVGVISNLRLLGKKKVAVILRLDAVAQMIDEMREFLPDDAHAECRGLAADVELHNQKIERFCNDNLERLRGQNEPTGETV